LGLGPTNQHCSAIQFWIFFFDNGFGLWNVWAYKSSFREQLDSTQTYKIKVKIDEVGLGSPVGECRWATSSAKVCENGILSL